MPTNPSFHSTIDIARGSGLFSKLIWTHIGTYVSHRDRFLSYAFSTHYHPYVAQLVQRLDEGGVAALQESDTVYLPQPNPPAGQPLQPLTVLAGSTTGVLVADITAPLQLAAGTSLTLPDGAAVTVKAGTAIVNLDGSASNLSADRTFVLPGFLPATSTAGIQSDNSAGAIIVPDQTVVAVTLPAGANAVVAADLSQVPLPAATQVAIRGGRPQPLLHSDDFSERYSPDPTRVPGPFPVNELDFSFAGAYSIYNWELFFHAPLLIAIHLSQNQKYQDAQTWFHYIFDPTDDSTGPAPQRFWKLAPFRYSDTQLIEQVLTNLAQNQDPGTILSITEWRDNPFQPWAVARYRVTSYMLKTVMAYLDNLLAWGDSLFQQYTIETINEATQLYVMAANILGPKPQAVPKKGSVKPLTYNDLQQAGLDAFGNALVQLETDIPFDMAPASTAADDSNGAQTLPSIAKTLYFCIPRNDVLLGYWDTVADRLFKIHNSLNLQGVFQRPPLYDPPIDPALLVRATAAGLDVSSVVSGMNQPLPLMRFQFLLAKATELCQEVKSLGANLLSAMEKRDNESIALLRSQHENAILGLTNVVRYAQWQEAIKATQAVQAGLDNAVQRYQFFQTVLGVSEANILSSIPQLSDLDLASLENLNFSQADPASEPVMPLDTVDPDIALDSIANLGGGNNTLSTREVSELNKQAAARDLHLAAGTLDALAALLVLIPKLGANAEPMGTGVTITFGGDHIGFSTSKIAGALRTAAEFFTFEAAEAGKLAGYRRRIDDWTFQSNSAKSEIKQILKQLRGAQIREAIAKTEYDNHQVQMKNAQQIVDFLQGNDIGPSVPVKETTVGFYALMKRDLKSLFARAFQLAFETARKAEQALQNELGDPSLSFVQFNYLDGNQGLLAGDKLMFDLKAMDMAYHDLNRREYELTKHVSLRQVAPLALVLLRATGACSFTIPEEALDFDCPGHYFRRIKSVALTLPCVAGPYAGVNCNLSLQQSTIRTKTDLSRNHYARLGPDDSRFNDYFGAVQSVVTSSGQADSGLFETNLRDERYLPFENAGIAASQWQLTLPDRVRQFDYDTITDVILHVRYTAREGGEMLRSAALDNLSAQIAKAQTVGSVVLLSVRHDFPSQWAKFKAAPPNPTSPLRLTFAPEHYPFWSQGRIGTSALKSMQLLAEIPADVSLSTININDKADQSGKADTLARNPLFGSILTGTLSKIALPRAVTDPAAGPFTLYLDNNGMDDLWIALTWGGSSAS